MSRLLLVTADAIVLGIGTAEYLTKNFPFRRGIAHIAQRGELQALVGRSGIYDTEMERAWPAFLPAERRRKGATAPSRSSKSAPSSAT